MLNVRAMLSSDVDAVYAIEVGAHRSPWTREILRDCVLVKYDCCVLEDDALDTPLIGYIICRLYENNCHLLNLCIASAFQNKRYGTFLLNHRLDALKSTPVNHVFLEVRPSNLPAIHLYQQVGFQQTGVKRGYYRDDQNIEDAIVLGLELK